MGCRFDADGAKRRACLALERADDIETLDLSHWIVVQKHRHHGGRNFVALRLKLAVKIAKTRFVPASTMRTFGGKPLWAEEPTVHGKAGTDEIGARPAR